MKERARQVATDALHLARHGDYKAAVALIEELSGTEGLIYAMTGWIDTFIACVHPGHRFGQPIAIKFYDVETGELGTADDVPPEKAWAGRLISYRAANDPEGFDAVLRSIPEGAALGDGIMTLLAMVATSLNNADATRRHTDGN